MIDHNNCTVNFVVNKIISWSRFSVHSLIHADVSWSKSSPISATVYMLFYSSTFLRFAYSKLLLVTPDVGRHWLTDWLTGNRTVWESHLSRVSPNWQITSSSLAIYQNLATFGQTTIINRCLRRFLHFFERRCSIVYADLLCCFAFFMIPHTKFIGGLWWSTMGGGLYQVGLWVNRVKVSVQVLII